MKPRQNPLLICFYGPDGVQRSKAFLSSLSYWSISYRSVTICLFCVFTVTLSKIKVKEDKYTKILAKNQICEIIHLRDITQIYKALYGDTLLVSL